MDHLGLSPRPHEYPVLPEVLFCRRLGGDCSAVLARQPGVVNLGQGFPDYDGSKAARAAAAEAMTDPSKVSGCD